MNAKESQRANESVLDDDELSAARGGGLMNMLKDLVQQALRAYRSKLPNSGLYAPSLSRPLGR